ncbi:SRPBCC domain-containing protein [Kutzneria viridogrisea]|uniref:Activator of Hsp90 ATPase homologue 1/2-like C-terminal domain-containing protein n=2 Tax=Kutzneria TaxID=43356 RepID=W5WFD3_9PSEU|nr:SRPBCC domain-containing protein [Kutzneria albida]AHH96874.1 hypothetical protein KALB_3510 [Kutzneria albida DSM 43870]MBA8927903.1 uncharacterized protein YndB with AHSA1/START domain [Kutzneria viridogrisea]
MAAPDRRAIRADQFLAHRPEVVWQALIDPELMARWLMPNDFKPVVGHLFSFRRPPIPAVDFDGDCQCEVLEIRPGQLLRISWNRAKSEQTVTWWLEPEGRGTRLFVEHAGFDPDDEHEQLSRRIMGGPRGWNGVLRRVGEVAAP